MEGPLIDPILGRMTWDEPAGLWLGEVEMCPGHRIEVFVDFDSDHDSREGVLAQARAWVARVRQREPEYRAWAAEHLLGGRWNLDEPMTLEDIGRLLRLMSIECESDGSARLYWDDEDILFYGHGFYTQLSPDGECVNAGLN